jgi:hypothetical protein
MPIDPRIALGFQGIDVGTILLNAQRMQQQRMEMENQKYQMDRRKADDTREDDYRGALGDVLTNGASFTQQPGGPTAEQRAVSANPEGYLSFQGKQLGISAEQLKQYRDTNETAMQLLSGVHDQASYDQAKTVAKNLYAQHGLNIDEMGLPPEYSPETVRDLQMRGMDTAHQVQAIARENKLNWDEYDDQQDNERADKSLQDLSGYREQVIDARRRGQDMVDQRTRRGQDMSSSDRQAAIRQRAEAAKASVQQRSEAAKMRGSGKPASVSAGDGAIIKNPKTGQRMKLQNGQWVPIP